MAHFTTVHIQSESLGSSCVVDPLASFHFKKKKHHYSNAKHVFYRNAVNATLKYPISKNKRR